MPDLTSPTSLRSLQGKLPGTDATAIVEFGTVIQNVDDLLAPSPAAESLYLIPGLIDVQINGFAGADYNDPHTSFEAILRSARAIFSTGVTRFFPTVITGSAERMTQSLRNLVACKEWMEKDGLPEAHAIEAFHVEGPYISPEDGPRGAHPIEHVRPPSISEWDRMEEAAAGMIRLVTLSPEWPQAPTFIRHVVRKGVVASIGHTKATTEQINAAVDAGATMSTHLGNGSFATLPKTNNYLWTQLAEDRLSASFVLDGIHLPTPFVQVAFRAKGIDRSILVTDAVMPAMCLPGPYRLGQVAVELRADGSVVLQGGTRLAGSALCMNTAVANAITFAKLSLRQAVAMGTVNPARVARVAGRQRGLTPGDKADLVLAKWDEGEQQLVISETVLAGHTVYRRQ